MTRTLLYKRARTSLVVLLPRELEPIIPQSAPMTDHMGLNYTGKLPNRPLDTSSEKTLAMQTLVGTRYLQSSGRPYNIDALPAG